MAKCLYSGDKPLGLVQSNAEDVAYDSNNSVKDMIDGITATIQGESIEITSYNTSSNVYTCPCDGYIFALTPPANSGRLEIQMQPDGILAWTIFPNTAANNYQTLFVKKGTQVYVSANTVTNAKAFFRY